MRYSKVLTSGLYTYLTFIPQSDNGEKRRGYERRFEKGLLILWFYNPLFYLAIEPQYLTVLVLHLNLNVLATLGATFRL